MRYPEVKLKSKLNVSVRTINRRSNELGFRTYRAIKRPFLSEKNRKKRLFMAKKFLKRLYLIEKIIFTDEKKFMNNNDSNIEYVRLTKTACKEEHILHQKKKLPSVHSTNATPSLFLKIYLILKVSCVYTLGVSFCVSFFRLHFFCTFLFKLDSIKFSFLKF